MHCELGPLAPRRRGGLRDPPPAGGGDDAGPGAPHRRGAGPGARGLRRRAARDQPVRATGRSRRATSRARRASGQTWFARRLTDLAVLPSPRAGSSAVARRRRRSGQAPVARRARRPNRHLPRSSVQSWRPSSPCPLPPRPSPAVEEPPRGSRRRPRKPAPGPDLSSLLDLPAVDLQGELRGAAGAAPDANAAACPPRSSTRGKVWSGAQRPAAAGCRALTVLGRDDRRQPGRLLAVAAAALGGAGDAAPVSSPPAVMLTDARDRSVIRSPVRPTPWPARQAPQRRGCRRLPRAGAGRPAGRRAGRWVDPDGRVLERASARRWPSSS